MQTLIPALFTLLGTLAGTLGPAIPKMSEAKRSTRQEMRKALISRTNKLARLCTQLQEDNARLPALFRAYPTGTFTEETIGDANRVAEKLDKEIDEIEARNRIARGELRQDQIMLSAEYPDMRSAIACLIAKADFLPSDKREINEVNLALVKADYEAAMDDFTDALTDEIRKLSD